VEVANDIVLLGSVISSIQSDVSLDELHVLSDEEELVLSRGKSQGTDVEGCKLVLLTLVQLALNLLGQSVRILVLLDPLVSQDSTILTSNDESTTE
jgi:hypothetical protein